MPIEQADRSLLGSYFCDQLTAVRQRRRTVEQKWLNSRKSWMNHVEGNYIPSDSGVRRYNVPNARRVLERVVVRCVKLLTPSVKWFEVAPVGEFDQSKLSNIDAFMSYVLRKRIKSRSIISQLVRCMVLYGRPVLKTFPVTVNNQVWPSWRAVDPFAFYTFPETAPTLEDCDLIFEDVLLSYAKYQTYVKMGIVEPIPRDDLSEPEWPYHLVERLAYQGLTTPGSDLSAIKRQVDGELLRSFPGYISCSEVWTTKEDKLHQAYVVWNHVRGPKTVGFYQSQYDTPLYKTSLHRPLPGETYTNSQAEDVADLDTIQNDLWNEFVQATHFESGFGAINTTAQARTDNLKIKPRELLKLTGDPREVLQWMQPPQSSTNALRGYQIAMGSMNSIGGNGTLSEGVPGRNMPRAGFAAQSLIDLGMADNQDLAEMVEQEVLTPGLGDIYKVAAMFIPQSQLMRIPGGKVFYAKGDLESTILQKQDILGDVEFEWVGSLQFADESARAERLMTFVNMIAQPQFQQQLQQQGVIVNWSELIPMLWRYGLGERGLDRILIKQEPPMPVPGEATGDTSPPPMSNGIGPNMIPQLPRIG